MKKFISFLLAFCLIFTLAACSQNPDENTDETTTLGEYGVNNGQDNESSKGDIDETEPFIEETVENTEKDTTKKTETEKTTDKKPVGTSKNPADWSKDEVVAFYKKSCEKSSHVTSKQVMTMRKDTLKAAGGLGKFLNFAEGIIRGVMKLNAIDVPGITGGHWDLVPSDCKTAKAYKSGNYIVVEMTMKDQTDGVYGKTFEGTVGHAISVVNGVAEVAEQFSDFDIRYKEADIKIHYTEAVVKVKINEKGVIEKGTWKYVCTPVVNDLYIEGIEVDDAGAVIDYVVTLNGGF